MKIFLKGYLNKIDRYSQQFMNKILKKISPTAEMTIAGSYRRKAKDSGDIDVLLKGHNKLYNKFIEVLENKGYLYETLAKGTKKYNGMCKLQDV